jgi:trimethylguanosine synthase
MVFVRKILLEDPLPSALDLHSKIRKLLYAMVDIVGERSGPPADIHMAAAVCKNGGHESSDDEVVLDHTEQAELELPISFGKRSSGKKRKRPHKRQRIQKLNPDFLTIDKSEHNLCMALNDGDGLYYPARIVGVGCSAPAGSFVVVTFLWYGTRAEVCRATHIAPVTELESKYQIENLLEQAGGDALATQEMHHKYWDQRYRLFSRFDAGIIIPDEESWFSVTPEVIGVSIANKLQQLFPKASTVLDCFCGCGGNAIHLASVFNTVLASDFDISKIIALRNNAGHYKVNEKIECIVCDAFDLLRQRLLAPSAREGLDVVLLAPPWGGMNYADKGCNFDMHTMFSFGDGFDLIELALNVCPNVVLLVPKNTHKTQFEELTAKFKVNCNVEDFYLHGKCKMTVAYIGPAFKSPGKRIS